MKQKKGIKILGEKVSGEVQSFTRSWYFFHEIEKKEMRSYKKINSCVGGSRVLKEWLLLGLRRYMLCTKEGPRVCLSTEMKREIEGNGRPCCVERLRGLRMRTNGRIVD